MAASQERIARACAAMKGLYGTPATAARNAVDQLLKVYENKWEFIEDNNYNVVFEYTQKHKNTKLKRTESDDHEYQASTIKRCKTAGNNLPIVVHDHNAKVHDQVIIELCSDHDEEPDIEPKSSRRKMKEEFFQPYPCKRQKTSNSGTDEDKENGEDLAKRAVDLTDTVSTKNELKLYEKDQSQPFNESKSEEDPIAEDRPEISCEFGSSSGKNTNGKLESSIMKSKPLYVKGECSHNAKTSEFDIASSDNGAVKISLQYNSCRIPNLDRSILKAITKKVEDKYRKIYGITDPDFSVTKLMEEICNCIMEIAAGDEHGECATKVSNVCNNAGGQHNDSSRMQPSNTYDSAIEPQISQMVHLDVPRHVNGSETETVSTKAVVNEASSSIRLKSVMNHMLDITRGEESVQIPLLNDNGAKELPKFFYISKNIAFKDAYVNFSLARISDDYCCSQCVGDCLSSELPCACAGETRGEFAYTPEGLVKESFLNEAITMSRKPKRQHFYYCENCPLEKPLRKLKRKRPCKGHLMRKFIKECWNKCGCNKKCGNRVVQRGITATLQVFSTPEGKGWGLRSVHALTKGTFVCEYVGEIVTNDELHERNEESSGMEEHTYPVLLDADWGSERVLKDEEALCLDATKYGNCARFINHRCIDTNLVEIPVEWETPDHHYYHLAFFTTRNIEPMEELTWDYGIQFDDKNHPIKAFNCKCGSKFCRDQGNS
ncbi:hypothetical protein PTKIN_Ptkin10aG0165300 [Pterospermum kingtungense]